MQPPHHAHPDPLDADTRIERSARPSDAQLVAGHEFRRESQIRAEGVLPDVDHYVIARGRGLFDLQVNREVKKAPTPSNEDRERQSLNSSNCYISYCSFSIKQNKQRTCPTH